MSVQYSVRCASPVEAEADLRRIWTNNISIGCDAGIKMHWTYRSAPVPATEVFLLASELKGASSVVGTSGILVRRVQVGGRMLDAALLGDFAVDASHRTLMPAMTLMRAVRARAIERYGVVYGFPNDKAVGVCRRVGFAELARVKRFARVLRHERFVRKYVDLPFVTRAGSVVVDAAMLARGVPAQARAMRTFKLVWLDDVDERFDDLWSRARSEYSIVAERSAAFVKWRLLEHPIARCRIAALVERGRRTRLHAYAAVHVSDDIAHIRDLFGHKNALGPLLDRLLPALWRHGPSSASFNYIGSDETIAELTSRGFAVREAKRAVIVDVGGETQGHGALVRDCPNWHLTDADEDI